jgi:hypothetical protein
MKSETSMQASGQRRAFGGLLVRKECWTLSRSAKIFIAAFCLVTILIAIRFMYPFLAITNRVHGQFLVVEGWIPPETLKSAVTEFKEGDYQMILTSGSVVRDHLNMEVKTTYANWAASDLRKLGISDDLVQAAPCWNDRRDRTYSSALAVKVWLDEHHLPVKSLDLITLGPHARRSRLLYEEAFGSEVKVGVIAIASPDYDAKHWWRYSEGVRDVVGEGIAYVYAKFLFWPSLESQNLNQQEGAISLRTNQ